MAEQGLNRCAFIGRLGRDAEIRSTRGGDAVLNFSLACTESYAGKDGVRKETTEWVPCVMWGKRASSLAQYLTKGAQVYVEGRFATRSWEKDGAKQYKTEITVTDVKLLGGKRDGAGGGQRRERDDGAHESAVADQDDGGDEDIPF